MFSLDQVCNQSYKRPTLFLLIPFYCWEDILSLLDANIYFALMVLWLKINLSSISFSGGLVEGWALQVAGGKEIWSAQVSQIEIYIRFLNWNIGFEFYCFLLYILSLFYILFNQSSSWALSYLVGWIFSISYATNNCMIPLLLWYFL